MYSLNVAAVCGRVDVGCCCWWWRCKAAGPFWSSVGWRVLDEQVTLSRDAPSKHAAITNGMQECRSFLSLPPSLSWDTLVYTYIISPWACVCVLFVYFGLFRLSLRKVDKKPTSDSTLFCSFITFLFTYTRYKISHAIRVHHFCVLAFSPFVLWWCVCMCFSKIVLIYSPVPFFFFFSRFR
jgi:hypothetical protein